MWRGISLANKCLIVFGGVLVGIVVVALCVPLLRMNMLVDEGQLAVSRQLVDLWERVGRQEVRETRGASESGLDISILTSDEAIAADAPAFARTSLEAFVTDPDLADRQRADWRGTARRYQYARAIRVSADAGETRLEGIVFLSRSSVGAVWQLLHNAAYLFLAGIVVSAAGVGVFHVITHRLILGPVRTLRRTAEAVAQGDKEVRSEIETGDEFEELAVAFNLLLESQRQSERQLRSMNTALDTKLDELAQANISLYEAARVKGEFLAGVSHELRTPLNSIIGFAELLSEIAQAELDAGDDSTKQVKRRRYLDNILNSGRTLLEMIDELLALAKIEAGKVEVREEDVDIAQLCDAIAGLAFPLGTKQGVRIDQEIEEGLPTVRTDPKMLRQILFNFVSNAVKFSAPGVGTERQGLVTIRAEQLRAGVDEPQGSKVRLSVIDTGPGIAAEDQARIFDRFQQLDQGHTRGHAGTGLGLAIAKELANLLQGEIQLVSEPGRGSMFSVIVPLQPDDQRSREIELEAKFRSALNASEAEDAEG